MNVIVSNRNANMFSNLDVDVIKSISGEFTVGEIVQSFSNFFFNRMFLDITAIENYQDVNTLKTLSVGLDVSKIILLLSGDAVVNSDTYISNIISMGFYNFAHNESEMMYLYNNPNGYKDVAHLQNINVVDTSYSDNVQINSKVIGFKNFTNHAGATSLIYMLKKFLSKNYYTVCVEVNKKDFMFFQDEEMVSCSAADLRQCIDNYKDANVILIDLNNLDISVANSICNDVIFLMESSTLMINKSIMLDNKCFERLSDRKVVLNRSVLSVNDVRVLEDEAGIKFFYVLPPLNDREDNSNEFYPFMEKLELFRRV